MCSDVQAALESAQQEQQVYEERMSHLEHLVNEGARVGSPEPTPKDLQTEVLGLQNAVQMLGAQKEAAEQTVADMENRLQASALRFSELTATHKSEKETLGKVYQTGRLGLIYTCC